ncbi:Queuine tRNA-ribosyltransferase subunit qtrtd1 [Mortierella hygrophila]|uniref:Queuine tRNA-ribosyltransferase accessory subunit 2 n=1 Tax=Mortierella hygrophila TaxID=979708 RepID=A0A9P6K3C0_9FUNG|nr:Queuine tRNA-ribosyltransferase subunit qtrtd1 [Mortierella hygrophila]
MTSPLKFQIKQTSAKPTRAGESARCGTFALSQSNTAGTDQQHVKRTIETPGCLMYSLKGAVPHLTPDNLRQQSFGGVNVSLEQILQTDQPGSFSRWPETSPIPQFTGSKFTLAEYLRLQDLITFCDLRDYSYAAENFRHPTTPPTRKLASNTDNHAVLSTPKGIRQLTLDDYLKTVRHYRPDVVVALADTIAETTAPNEKRVRKSLERSLKWLDQILLERAGQDGTIEDRRAEEEKKRRRERKEKRRSAAAAAKAAGEQQEQDQDQDQEQGAGTSKEKEEEIYIEPIPTEPWTDVGLFAAVGGAHLEESRIWSAQETAKKEGVDGFVIDTLSLSALDKDARLKHVQTSLDHLPADKPRLLYGLHAPEDVLEAVAMGIDLFDTSYPFQLAEDGRASLYYYGPRPAGQDKSNSKTQRSINLWDDEHGDKFVPILEGCRCYACKDNKHTRAYINHLLKTHEMLATVLLMGHNMYQYSQFFILVRESIQDGTLQEKSTAFLATFGKEPTRTLEKHPNQIIVEAALQKRNQRLEGAEEGVVGVIGMGASTVNTPSLGAAVGAHAEDVEMEDSESKSKKRHETEEAGEDGGAKDEVVEKKVKKAAVAESSS